MLIKKMYYNFTEFLLIVKHFFLSAIFFSMVHYYFGFIRDNMALLSDPDRQRKAQDQAMCLFGYILLQ